MKKVLALVALLTVGAVQAEELKFGDLNYFLKEGQKNLVFNFADSSEDTRSSGTQKVQVAGYLADLAFGYAVTDRLNAFVRMAYFADVRTELGNNHFNTNGLQNPQLGANYRFLNQDEVGFNLDFGAILGIQVQDRKVGNLTPKKNGNNLDLNTSSYSDPRSFLELNARAGKKWNEANEVYFLAGMVYNKASDYRLMSNSRSTDLSSSYNYKLGAFYQYRPVMEFMMTLGAQATRYGSYEEKDSSGPNTSHKSHIDTQFIFNAKYRLTESFIVKLFFNQDKRSDFNLVDDTGAKSTFDRRSNFTQGVGLDYLF